MSTELLTALVDSAVVMAVPLLYAALGELIGEKAGVINIGLEGMLLLGAFGGFAAAHATGSPALGYVAAIGTGALGGALFAFFAVARNGNQIVVGTAVNLLALGATGVGYRALFGVTGSALSIEPPAEISIPLLSSLPVVGPLFQMTPLGYLCLALIATASWMLARTQAGLILRMCGENPHAATTQGIDVVRTRTVALIACGALCAAGGAYLAVDYTHTFVEGMSAGRGFIALAIVIIGRRSGIGITAAALLFGFAMALQFQFQALSFGIPYQFFLILPYVATLILLCVSAGDTHAPAALGEPYDARK